VIADVSNDGLASGMDVHMLNNNLLLSAAPDLREGCNL
jgi:hypothetical protein